MSEGEEERERGLTVRASIPHFNSARLFLQARPAAACGSRGAKGESAAAVCTGGARPMGPTRRRRRRADSESIGSVLSCVAPDVAPAAHPSYAFAALTPLPRLALGPWARAREPESGPCGLSPPPLPLPPPPIPRLVASLCEPRCRNLFVKAIYLLHTIPPPPPKIWVVIATYHAARRAAQTRNAVPPPLSCTPRRGRRR
jgi:hypothetical protein